MVSIIVCQSVIGQVANLGVQEIDEALQSRMSPEEEEAVQAELEALQREAMVRTHPIFHSLCLCIW